MLKKTFAYVGNWTVQAKNVTAGIGIYDYNTENGSLKYIKTVRSDIVAGCITIDEEKGVLYAVDEQQNNACFGGLGGGGRVVAFKIDPSNGDLSELGEEQSSIGTLPAYLALDGTGQWLVVANHGDKQAITKVIRKSDGTLAVKTDFSDVTVVLYPIGENGAVLPPVDAYFFQPDMSSVPAKIASIHAVYFAPDGKHFIVSNMKQDTLVVFYIDDSSKSLKFCSSLKFPSGNWPRYCAFHPTKNIFYVNNEHALVLDVVSYDDAWNMKIVQTFDPTPALDLTSAKDRILQSDIRISKDGKHIYNFYRGLESVSVFSVDNNGMLEMIQYSDVGGIGPRSAMISPDGKFILITNMKSSSIATFTVNADGTLSPTQFNDTNMTHPGWLSFYQSEC